MKTVQPLPIDPLVPEIVRTVEQNPITLLQAEPGAGKTTRVPPALADNELSHVYVLEPRRLAARMAARRVAQERGERVGGVVGYRVRFEEAGGNDTRLWYVTEGVLTRKLLSRNELMGVRVAVLDEFHERHLETDLALALLRRLQESRPRLRLLIMSATLPADDLSAKLGNPPIIRAPGRLFPVDISYTPHSAAPLEEQVASAVSRALQETNGHILVFLSGAAEIRKVMQACEPLSRKSGAKLLPLHGDLSTEQQDTAVEPSAARKIICSTNVAESSLTIDGVEAVVDSGVARVMNYSRWSGLSHLRVEKISKASAIQRAGRAGRTGPGITIRLYSEADFVRRPEQIAPEITRADLTPMMLLLAANGVRSEELKWIDEPPPEMRERGHDLLQRLGAIDDSGSITSTGKKMAQLPIHPRLARFILEAAGRSVRSEACEIAARLSEDRIRIDEETRGRFSSDLDAILSGEPSYAARRLKEQLLGVGLTHRPLQAGPHAIEMALLAGYPDRVARKRGDVLLLANGTSAKLDRASHTQAEFLVALELNDRSDLATPLVRIASGIEPDWLLNFFPDHVSTREETVWNREAERVEQVHSLLYDRLVIDESRSVPADLEAAALLLTDKALEAGTGRFTDSDELERFLRRVQFAAQHSSLEFPPDLLDVALRELAAGLTSFAQLRDAAREGGLLAVLQGRLPMREIEEVAPAFVKLPSGRRARIDYHEGRPPSVASRLQDFFGMQETPSVARGAVPLVVELLAPNRRPVQVTTDLVSFWKNLYPQVRRELSRRYPKHAWPEVPA